MSVVPAGGPPEGPCTRGPGPPGPPSVTATRSGGPTAVCRPDPPRVPSEGGLFPLYQGKCAAADPEPSPGPAAERLGPDPGVTETLELLAEVLEVCGARDADRLAGLAAQCAQGDAPCQAFVQRYLREPPSEELWRMSSVFFTERKQWVCGLPCACACARLS